MCPACDCVWKKINQSINRGGMMNGGELRTVVDGRADAGARAALGAQRSQLRRTRDPRPRAAHHRLLERAAARAAAAAFLSLGLRSLSRCAVHGALPLQRV